MNYRRIYAVFKYELFHMRRDGRSFLNSLLLPTFFLFLIAYAVNTDIQPSSLAVYNADPSPISRFFLQNFSNTPYFRLKMAPSAEEALGLVKNGRVKGAIFIPPNFTEILLKKNDPSVHVVLDGMEPLSTRLYLNYLDAAISDYPQKLTETFYFLSHLSTKKEAPFQLKFSTLFNPTNDHFAFIVPGLVGCILMAIIPFLSAISIVREREGGCFDRVLASPASSLEFLLGKLAFYFLLALVNCILLTFFARYYFKISFQGNWSEYIIVCTVFSFWAVAFGLLISTFTRSQMTALITSMVLTILPAFIFSGLYFPLHAIPLPIRWITYILPARYFVEIARETFLKGNTFLQWWGNFIGLCVVTLVTFGLMFYRFQKINQGPS